MGAGRPAHVRAVARAGARDARPGRRWTSRIPRLWDAELIAEGRALLRRASALWATRSGASSSRRRSRRCTATAPAPATLDAETLVTLYRGLVAIAPTAGARAALAAAEERSALNAQDRAPCEELVTERLATVHGPSRPVMMEGSGCADSTSAPLPDPRRHPCRVVTRPCEPPSSASRSPRWPSPGALRAERRPAARASAPADEGYITPGKLTIATGEPAYYPYVIDDDPSSGEGFEAAIAYAVAEELGFAAEDVEWVRTTFEAAIAPGPKTFDINIQQYSITDERKENVDFSSPYYAASQASSRSRARPPRASTTLDGRKDLLLGAHGRLHERSDDRRGRAAHDRAASSTTPTKTRRRRSKRVRSTDSCSTCRPRSTRRASYIENSFIVGELPTARHPGRMGPRAGQGLAPDGAGHRGGGRAARERHARRDHRRVARRGRGRHAAEVTPTRRVRSSSPDRRRSATVGS